MRQSWEAVSPHLVPTGGPATPSPLATTAPAPQATQVRCSLTHIHPGLTPSESRARPVETCVQGLWVFLVATKENWTWAAGDASDMREVARKEKRLDGRTGMQMRKGKGRESEEREKKRRAPFLRPPHFRQGPPAARR